MDRYFLTSEQLTKLLNGEDVEIEWTTIVDAMYGQTQRERLQLAMAKSDIERFNNEDDSMC